MMDSIKSFFSSLFAALMSRIGAEATDYGLAVSKGIFELAQATITVVWDSTLTTEEKRVLYFAAKNALSEIVETAKAEGIQIAEDLPLLLAQAGGDQLMSAFGFNKNATAVKP